jgi:hypothetical protein
VNGRNDAAPAITNGICPKSNLTNQIQLNLQPAINRLSMEKGESQMFRLALLIWVVLGTTLAGVGVVVVVSDASLYSQGMKLIPIAAMAGFIVAIPLSFMVSKRIS